jgi:type IV pilus assembly protein PilV
MKATLMRRRHQGKRETGVMLLEALIAILIFSIGILAVVGLQAAAIKTVADSKYRSEASFLANQLVAQMWTDNGNIANYAYPGGTAPALTAWVAQVTARMPGAVPPIVTITGATVQGGQVMIDVRWRTPEETAQGLPPHFFRVIASVYPG